MKVYLAGPIFQSEDHECIDWRREARKKLNGIEVFDPMDRDYRGATNENYERIVEEDKELIDEAQVLLVNHIKPSAGTSMEILFSWEQHKRVILVSTQEKMSPWLVYHSNIIYSELDHAIEEINEIYNNDSVIVKYGSFLRTSSG